MCTHYLYKSIYGGIFMQNCNLDFIGEVYRNASVALQSISDVMPEVENEALRNEIHDQYEGYEKFISELTTYMREKGYEIKDNGAMKMAMMWSAIKMNTAFDSTHSHIAEIMIKGTVMGITELTKIINETECLTDDKAMDFAKRLLSMEEDFEERLKKHL